MSKTIAQLRSEMTKKHNTENNTYKDLPEGTQVQVIAPCCDFHFFYGETGIVTESKDRYLGIGVMFDKPRHLEDGMIQKGYNFNPEDLYVLKPVAKIPADMSKTKAQTKAEIIIDMQKEINQLKDQNEKLKGALSGKFNPAERLAMLNDTRPIEKMLNQQQTKIKQLGKIIVEAKATLIKAVEAGIGESKRQKEQIVELQAKLERLEYALVRLQNWTKAYPLVVFPEPDFVKVRKALDVAGISLDVVSASNMRHVLTGITNIIEQALKG